MLVKSSVKFTPAPQREVAIGHVFHFVFGVFLAHVTGLHRSRVVLVVECEKPHVPRVVRPAPAVHDYIPIGAVLMPLVNVINPLYLFVWSHILYVFVPRNGLIRYYPESHTGGEYIKLPFSPVASPQLLTAPLHILAWLLLLRLSLAYAYLVSARIRAGLTRGISPTAGTCPTPLLFFCSRGLIRFSRSRSSTGPNTNP